MFHSQQMNLVYRNVLIALFVVMALIVTFLAVITAVLIDAAKDTQVSNDKLLARGSGEVAQCASSDYYVNSQNVMVKRDSANRRELLSSDDSKFVADALAVRNHKEAVTLSSTLPDKYFEELLWFKIISNTGLQLSFNVQGLSRVMTKSAKCGTLLKILTSAGILILDDKDIYYTDDLFGLFQESGFHPSKEAPVNQIAGRRLQSNSKDVSFSITGFFNAINDYNWKCESVEKPSLPTSNYALKTRTLSPCNNAPSGEPSKCFFTPYPDNVQEIFGTISVNGEKYFEMKRDWYEQSDGTHIVDYLPHRPGVKSVISMFPASGDSKATLWRYQIESDGQLTHCGIDEASDIKMGLPDDFIFYPIDDAGKNLMHFIYNNFKCKYYLF